MDDIVREDRRLWRVEALRPGRVFLSIVSLAALFGIFTGPLLGNGPLTLAAFAAVPVVHLLTAYKASVDKRFINRRYAAMWHTVQDRLAMFDEVLARMRKDQIADLQELPKNIHRVSNSLYYALRRADLIDHEVTQTEKGLYHMPPAWKPPSHDAQAKELYRIADKNIAEYRSRFAGVMAGVQRTEAQCAVLTTTIDTLRMKMIGYRLVGRSPELSSKDFLDALQEAKMQLAAIDQALEELELTPFPQTVAVLPNQTPPPLPITKTQELEQGE
ncbi:MAG: hypothetical protein HZC36_07705 [Armatimonadetes bacterium]|nr:hypothetical protein [Armatimonadota bacterium]